MSAIAGIYSVEGRQIEEVEIRRLMDVQLWPPSDVQCTRITGDLALGYHGFVTTHRQFNEIQPLSDNDGRLWLVSDARIDNRSELLESLYHNDHDQRQVPDSVLILEAYKQWGGDCASKIIGDFAFVVRDIRARTLFCARDALGVRPLFYSFDGKTFAFASFIRQLIAGLKPGELDDEYIADFMARGDCLSERTVYRTIKPVMPGQAIFLEEGRLKKVTYWDFDPHSTIRYKNDAEYESHFRNLLFSAVESRLCCTGKVAADLSGGLDSSSIVCVAQEAYRSQKTTASLIVYTDVFESRKLQETKWADMVIHKYGLESIRRHADSGMFPIDFDPRADSWDQPTLKVLALPGLRGKGAALAERGIRVLLSGIGGDQVLQSGYDPFHLADFVRTFRWVKLLKESLRWQESLSLPVAKIVREYALEPLLHPTAMWSRRDSSEDELPWIDKGFSRRFDIHHRLLHRRGFLPRRFESIAQQRHYLGIMRTCAALVEAAMMRASVEVRYPYLDRRLAEFALAIPIEQKIRPRETRSILRRSLRGILPDSVRLRTSKGWFGESLLRRLARDRYTIEKWLTSSRAAAYGYLDPVEFTKSLDRACVGFCQNGYLFFAALALEIWLQGLDARWQLAPVPERTGELGIQSHALGTSGLQTLTAEGGFE